MQVVIAAAQFIYQTLQMGRQIDLGANVLPQPFGHGIADRPGRTMIDLVEIVVKSAVHGGFLRRRVGCCRVKS